jgi:hypothetical protein
MEFIFNDGGRAAAGYKGSAGDCVARAVAIVSGRPYDEVYKVLADGRGEQRVTKRTGKKTRSARNGINVKRKWFKDYMASLGFTWTPTMKIGQGCKVHLQKDELPAGKLVVAVSGHYTTVIDGVIHDTYDPNNREASGWWSDYADPETVKAPGPRCVYGYWSLM